MPRAIRSTSKILRRAAELRRRQTPEEAKLWSRLRNHQLGGVGFRRQHAIGKYITDFCAPGRRLIIELDGAHHDRQAEYDRDRTAYLESRGFHVIRFSNWEVRQDVEAVLRAIWLALSSE